jgi:hypothetical protein
MDHGPSCPICTAAAPLLGPVPPHQSWQGRRAAICLQGTCEGEIQEEGEGAAGGVGYL